MSELDRPPFVPSPVNDALREMDDLLEEYRALEEDRRYCSPEFEAEYLVERTRRHYRAQPRMDNGEW